MPKLGLKASLILRELFGRCHVDEGNSSTLLSRGARRYLVPAAEVSHALGARRSTTVNNITATARRRVQPDCDSQLFLGFHERHTRF